MRARAIYFRASCFFVPVRLLRSLPFASCKKPYNRAVFNCGLAAIFLFFLGISANAADFTNCKVIEIVASGLKNAHVALDCEVTPRPACATAGSFFGFDKSTEEGRQYLSMVLTAFSTGATLTGYVDDNNCSPYQGNVSWVYILRMRK